MLLLLFGFAAGAGSRQDRHIVGILGVVAHGGQLFGLGGSVPAAEAAHGRRRGPIVVGAAAAGPARARLVGVRATGRLARIPLARL